MSSFTPMGMVQGWMSKSAIASQYDAHCSVISRALNRYYQTGQFTERTCSDSLKVYNKSSIYDERNGEQGGVGAC